MLLNPLTFHSPKTALEAAKLYSKLENVKLHAGGTFLLNALKLLKRKGPKTPENIVSLGKVGDLKGILIDEKSMTIKSMTTIADLFESSDLKDNFSVFRTVCRNISTQPIRNMATVGGNMTCRYTWTEMPAVMIGLGATMHFLGADGKEEELAAEEFYKSGAKTDKILSHIVIPRDKNAKIAYRRVKKTQFVDVPLLSILIKTNFEGKQFTNTRVSVNNCVVFAQRDTSLEDFLNQSQCNPHLAEEALDHLDNSIYDTRCNDYKKHMFRVSIRNAIRELNDNNENA